MNDHGFEGVLLLIRKRCRQRSILRTQAYRPIRKLGDLLI